MGYCLDGDALYAFEKGASLVMKKENGNEVYLLLRSGHGVRIEEEFRFGYFLKRDQDEEFKFIEGYHLKEPLAVKAFLHHYHSQLYLDFTGERMPNLNSKSMLASQYENLVILGILKGRGRA